MNTKTKKQLCSFVAVAFTLTASAFIGSNSLSASAEESLPDKLHFGTGASLSTYKGYARYEGYKLNANGEVSSFTSSANTALVFKIKNNVRVGYAFYLNGQLNSGTSSVPTTTYRYDGETYVASVSHGSYSIGYYISTTDYDTIVVPTTNFTNASSGTAVSISDITMAIRLKGAADSNLTNSSANLDLYGIYLTENFTAEGDLDVSSLKTVYTPAKDSYSEFDSGNTGITSACITASYYTKANVTCAPTENGTVTATPCYAGETSTITATADSGYELSSLKINGSEVQVTGGVYTLTNAPENVSVEAVFSPIAYTVTSEAENATITVASSITHGGNLEISWQGNENCVFEKLLINDAEVQVTGTSYTLENVTDNVSVKVIYKGVYSPNVTPSENGSVSCNVVTYSEGDAITFTATADAGYELDKLIVNGNEVQVSNGAYTLENAPVSVTVSATFKKLVYTVTASTCENGSITVDNNDVEYLGSVVITPVANSGYAVDKVYVNGEEITAVEGVYTATNITENVTVSATFKGNCTISATAGNGIITCNKTTYAPGEDIIITAKPNAGYELSKVSVNGQEVQVNAYGQCRIENANANVNVVAEFVQATSYALEGVSISSIYNNYGGTIYAQWDSVSVKTVKDVSALSDYKYIGVTTANIGKEVASTQYIAVDIQNMDANWRTFYIDVNGVSTSGTYYMVDRLGNIYSKTGNAKQGVITEKYTRVSNATLNLGTTAVEGFVGTIVIPVSNYGDISNIDTISIYSGIKSGSRARFNVGAIRILNSFDNELAGDISSEEIIWAPSQDNYTAYVSGEENVTEEYAKLTYLNANDYLISNVPAANPKYDVFYATLPQNMIGSDGYVDISALGIKGILLDVENYNLTQTEFAIRIAGADNSNLTNTKATLWQTANAGQSKVIYENGLVRIRGAKYLPYDESGDYSGKWYIPLSSEAFTNIGSTGAFPTKIQPVIRILFSALESDAETYKANIKNITFVTDDSAYELNTIVMTGIGGTISGNIGNAVIGLTANNKVLDGTEAVFTVTPERGYTLSSVKYTMGDGQEQEAVAGDDGKYRIIVTGDLTITYNCTENEYKINYILNGGTNNDFNPECYYLSDGKITLLAPEKEGTTFLRWETEDGEEIEEIDCELMQDITVKAIWKSAETTEGGCFGASANFVGSASLLLLAGAVCIAMRKKHGDN